MVDFKVVFLAISVARPKFCVGEKGTVPLDIYCSVDSLLRLRRLAQLFLSCRTKRSYSAWEPIQNHVISCSSRTPTAR